MFEPIITWVISSEPETLKDDPLEAQYCAKAKEGIKKDKVKSRFFSLNILIIAF